MAQYTTYADRQEIVTLHQQGYSYGQIVQQTSWSFETVRKICRTYNRAGDRGIQLQRVGRPALGALSSFDPLVRWACLRIKCQHPGWGPEVVLAELATRPCVEVLAQVEAPGWRGHAHYAESLRVKGWIMQQLGGSEEAERLFRSSLEIALAQQAKSWELRTATTFAAWLKQEGRGEEGRALLQPVYSWFTEGFDTRDLKAAKALLDDLPH